eukprot:GFUD01068633.1.p1 GENE.GFUD01068633.1~~GFUD01068633.1.p1  ORF type:complete len:340 (-),score=53.41 GFUD01068633.1:121-1140(-)
MSRSISNTRACCNIGGNMQAVEELLGEKIPIAICKACDDGTFKTENVQEFVGILGLRGKCHCNAENILLTFCQEQKCQGMSPEHAQQTVLSALRDPKVQQLDLVNKLSRPSEEDMSSEQEGLLSSSRKPTSASVKGMMYSWKVALILTSGICLCLVVLAICLSLLLLMTMNQSCSAQEDQQIQSRTSGLVGIIGLSVVWIERCSSGKYSASISNLDTVIKDFAVGQVGNEIWLCGGRASRKNGNYEQSKTCLILSLLNGKWTPSKHRMAEPRIKPVMFVAGGKVIVKSGQDSDVNSRTGCRATQEVFDRDNSTEGWVSQHMEENHFCQMPSQLVTINCQ